MRIEGIYHQDIIKALRASSIHHFSFDFRAASFNFMQQYKFMALMESCGTSLDHYYLQFENEKNFIIEKIIEDFKKLIRQCPDRGMGFNIDIKKIFLEFSDLHEACFYEQFRLPFYWHYHGNISLQSIVSSPFCYGIVLSYAYLFELHDRGEFFTFVTEFMNVARKKIDRGQCHLILKCDWDSDIFSSFFDFLPIEICSMAINHKVESSYRQVDLKKLGRELSILKP